MAYNPTTGQYEPDQTFDPTTAGWDGKSYYTDEFGNQQKLTPYSYIPNMGSMGQGWGGIAAPGYQGSSFFDFSGPGSSGHDPYLDYLANNGGGNSSSSGMTTIGDGTVPVNTRPNGVTSPDPTMGGQYPGGAPTQGQPAPGQPMDPNSPYFQYWLQQHSGNPNPSVPGVTPGGPQITGTNKPAGVDMSSPTTVPALTSTLPPPVVSTNPGNDPNNPPDNSGDWFWSGTGNHWVDRTGQRDATGRYLTDSEKQYWTGYDHARASANQASAPGLFNDYLNTAKNPGLPAGTNPSYVPYGTQPVATTATATTAAPVAAAQQPASPFDYSKQGSVPYYAFEKNVYADTNAQQSFAELQGVMTPEALQKAQQAYGWQKASDTTTPDANAVYASAIQLAKADPNSDYSIVRVAMPDGSTGYGILKRENGGGNVQAMQQAQTARGFISPAVAIQMAQARQQAAQAAAAARSGGGGGGTPKSTSFLPKPQGQGQGQGLQWPAQNFSISNYQIPAASNPANILGKPGAMIGQTTSYGGELYQWNGSTWVKQPNPVANGGGGGGYPGPHQQTR